MPFSLIPTVLGACFALIWMFIAAIVVRDGQFAVRRERESGGGNWRPPQKEPPQSGRIATRRARNRRPASAA